MLCRRTAKRTLFCRDITKLLILPLLIAFLSIVSYHLILKLLLSKTTDKGQFSIIDETYVLVSRDEFKNPTVISDGCSLLVGNERQLTFTSTVLREWEVPAYNKDKDTSMELSLYLSKDTDFGWKIYSTTKCSGKMVYQNKGVVFYTNSTTKDTTYRINATGFYWFHLGNCTDGIIPRQIFTINTPRYNELQTKFHSVTGRAGNSSMIVVSVPGRGRYCEFKIVDTPFSWNQMNTFSLIPLFCLLFIVSLTPCSYSIMSLSFVRCYWPCCSPSKAEVQGERHLEEQKLNKGRCQIKLPRRGPTSEFDGKERLFELMDAENEEAMGTLFDIEYDPDDTGLGLEEEIPLEQAHNDEQKDGPDGPLSEANLENRTELVPMMD